MSQPESLITLGTNLLWCDSSLYYRPWPHNTEIPVHGFLPFVIVVFVCPLKVMVCQAWYLLCRSLQQQMCSLFLTSSLGWHVKQDFLILGCPANVAVNGCFEITMKGKNGGTGGGESNCKQKLFRNFTEVSHVFLECFTWVWVNTIIDMQKAPVTWIPVS